MTEWSTNLQTASAPTTELNHTDTSMPTTSNLEGIGTAISKEKSETKVLSQTHEPHLNRVNVKTISHLVNIICAKECTNQTPLPTDKCRVLSERLLIELSKGNTNTKQDMVKLLTSNIESVLETLTGVLHVSIYDWWMRKPMTCNLFV